MSHKILIVDDYEDNRYTLKRRLKRDGYLDCQEAESGLQAIKMLEAEPFDLMLLDLMMPGMDGFQVLEHIKQQERFRHLPIIMISAADDLAKVAKGIELGAEDYLAKPFNPVILRARVQSALEKREKSLAQLETLGFIDDITGLPNEAALIRDFPLISDSASSVALIEVYFSKYANVADGYGKSTADKYILAQLACIKSHLTETDMVFKHTASSFIVVLRAFGQADEVVAKAKNLLQKLNKSVVLDDVTVVEEVRLGVVMDLTHSNSIDTLLQQMGSATSQASKKMPISYYAESIQASLLEKIQLEADLRDAIVNDELVLFYQPQVDVKTNKICAAEALVRWIHPKKGLISPNDFIPLAEENGMVVELGESVIKMAVLQLKQWIAEWPGEWTLPVSVNVSAQHIIMPELVTYVEDMLATHNLPSHLLKLELTESALVEDSNATIDVLQSMQTLGLKVSLDDFGTGFSSLSYLLELPLNQLKIDKKFIDNVVHDDRSKSVLKHVIGLAHDLSLDIVVEGVEDVEQADLVINAGADYIQGYFFFKPLPSDEFYQVLLGQH